MTQYAIRNIATQNIEYAVGRRDPEGFVGPLDAPPILAEGYEALLFQGLIPFDGRPTPTSELKAGPGNAPVWTEVGDMPSQREHKAAAISSCCADAILAGFVSSALGAPHTYPAKPTDQINLTGSVMRSFYPDVDANWRARFWCADSSGAWAYREHTAAQIQRAGDDAVAARWACSGINEKLQAQIIAAATPADLADINWPE
jgi:hypothetical protein